MIEPGVMAERPPYLTFHYEAVEDRNASIDEGRKVYKNVPFVTINLPGGKDAPVKNAEEWFEQIRHKAHTGSYPQAWVKHFESQYHAWQEGQEMPEHGTPVQMCLFFSAAEQQALIAANVRTLEDAAVMTEECLSLVGMGARQLKEKAQAAIRASTDAGKLAEENQALKVLVSDLQDRLKALEEAAQRSVRRPREAA
ncbi:MAG: hypothetical protein RIR00_939 [Pseudomonadota bacterium]|jgi:hypothetical protein